MKRLFPLALTLLCGIGTTFADVVTTTTCQLGNGPVTTNPTGCSLNGPNSQPLANASIAVNQLTPISNAGSVTSFSVDISGSARAQPFVPVDSSSMTTTAQAISTANANYLFSTAGPVRQGIVMVNVNPLVLNRGAGDDNSEFQYSLGSLSGSCGANAFCQGAVRIGGPLSLSFTLGTTFAFNFSESFQAIGTFNDGVGSANGEVGLEFQLFEADGKTPVALSAAPEPNAFSLLALAGPLAWLYWRRVSRA